MLAILGVKPENEKNELPADCRRGRTVASQGCTTVMEPCTCRTEGDNGQALRVLRTRLSPGRYQFYSIICGIDAGTGGLERRLEQPMLGQACH